MSRVAIVTDSASDFDPREAAALGITVVPLIVNFGAETFSAGVNLSTDDVLGADEGARLAVPDDRGVQPGRLPAAPTRRRSTPARTAIVSVHVAGTLSGTIKAAEIAQGDVPGPRDPRRRLDVGIDGRGRCSPSSASRWPTMGVSAARDRDRARRAGATTSQVYLALDTLEYLKRGGRISGAQAAIGTLLSVKPIIKIKDGLVETAERVRTRGKAREQLVELLTRRGRWTGCRSCTRPTPTSRSSREQLIARVPGGIDRSKVTIDLVGPSVGPHLGPGCVGAVALYREAWPGLGGRSVSGPADPCHRQGRDDDLRLTGS